MKEDRLRQIESGVYARATALGSLGKMVRIGGVVGLMEDSM